MEFFNDDRIPNPCDYSNFGNEDSNVTVSKYNADIYHDYHYVDFSESFDYYDPFDQFASHSADVTQQDLPTPTRSPRNIWVRKSKLPVQPVHCDVCDCNLNSSAQAEAHFKGQSHQKRLKKIRAVDPACINLNHGTDTWGIVAEGYSSFENCETLSSTDNPTTEVDERLEEQATMASLIDPSSPQDQEEFRVTEPPKKKQRVVLAIPCEICGLTFNSEGQAEDHFNSLKHIRKIHLLQQITVVDDPSLHELRPNPPGKCQFHCSVCNVTLNSNLQFDQHCSGQGHKKKLLNCATPENEVLGHKSGWFYCRICDISCRTVLGLQKHVLSEDHKTKTRAEAEPITLAEVEAKTLAETEGKRQAETETEAKTQTETEADVPVS